MSYREMPLLEVLKRIQRFKVDMKEYPVLVADPEL